MRKGILHKGKRNTVHGKMKATASLWAMLIIYTMIPVVCNSNPIAKLPLIARITADDLGRCKPVIRVDSLTPGVRRVSVSYELTEAVKQQDCAIRIVPAFVPHFHWAPHLTPTGNHVIDQHVFRTPALIVQDNKHTLIVIPETGNISANSGYRTYLDMDAPGNTLMLGMANTKVTNHVLYEKSEEALFPSGTVELAFYVITTQNNRAFQRNPFRYALSALWHHKGLPVFQKSNVSTQLFNTYCEHTYRWAFEGWKDAVWQEFTLNGKTVGAPVFIVNTTQSPNYPGRVNEREMRSIWNQAWFSSLRSASGLYRYARRTGNNELMQKALLTKELALSAPQKEGLFYSVIATEMEEVEENGRKYHRSKGWDTAYWGNSNRNPITGDIRKSPFHILDMSWTAYIMLQWYDELEKDERLLNYARRYADALLNLQDAKGYFPAWLDTATLQPLPYLNDSPESGMSALFLLKAYQLTGKQKYRTAALKCVEVIEREIVPVGRWEDFETYWSCCRYGSEHLVGKKEQRNNMYKQCNFSMFWTASALLEAYNVTNQPNYLSVGQRVVDELLMTQASWQPPYIYVDAVGGFGVMNADGEWNDARGSLFAEMLLHYGKLLNNPEYTQRGLMALKTSFSMMYCPENPRTKELWEKTWPFFSSEDYGFMMENYSHGGITSPEGEGMGEFTIYDWGNGAAAEAYNRIVDHWGTELFTTPQGLVPTNLKKVAKVTGRNLPNENLPNPNRTDLRYDVGGTDLGILWAMEGNKVGIWFGDTYGKTFTTQPTDGSPITDNWRCNVLAFSSDTNMEDGLTIDSMVTDGKSKAIELLYGAKNTSGQGDWTSIPTAAIRANGTDYVHFMNVKNWGAPGRWDTNYSAVYSSADDGVTWYPTGVTFGAKSNFSQVAYARKDGYVYMAGTLSGRVSSVYLARFREEDIVNQPAYQYWNNEKGWVQGGEYAATPIVNDKAGELSLIYHRGTGRWIMTYLSGKKYAIVLRDAADITGPWSEDKVLVRGEDYPALYGAFMHPLADDGNELYFLMSQWSPYNVYLMKTTISE